MTDKAEKTLTPEELLDAAMARMNKKFGDRTVGRLGDKPVECEVIPTGSLALDLALGIGGAPRKRITVVWGMPGSGKTTLMQHLAAECQQMGGTAAYIDMEHKLDQAYAQACGMNLKDIIFSQPPSGTAALEIARSLIDHVDLIIVDSVYDLVTPAELNSDPGDDHWARLARLMSQELKKLKPQLGFSNCALVFVNQVRTGMGSQGRAYHVNPGGFAVSFAPSIVVKLKRISELPKKTGILSEAYVGKNNVAVPFKKCEIAIVSGTGIAKYHDLLEAAVFAGVIERAGSWYKYQGENMATSSGKLPAIEVLERDKKLAQTIREEALAK